MSHNKHNYNPNNKDPKAAADTEKAKKQQQAAQEAASDDVDVIEDVEALDSEDQTETLEGQILELNKKLEEEKNKYLLLYADFDNFRKRTIREKAELIKNGGEQAFKGLLPVIDDFERGLEAAAKDENADPKQIEGFRLIYNKLKKYLEQNGVKEFDMTDDTFNADCHEAIAAVPAPSEDKKGKILDTVQKGYTLNDKVLRHAKVVVGQ